MILIFLPNFKAIFYNNCKLDLNINIIIFNPSSTTCLGERCLFQEQCVLQTRT